MNSIIRKLTIGASPPYYFTIGKTFTIPEAGEVTITCIKQGEDIHGRFWQIFVNPLGTNEEILWKTHYKGLESVTPENNISAF